MQSDVLYITDNYGTVSMFCGKCGCRIGLFNLDQEYCSACGRKLIKNGGDKEK